MSNESNGNEETVTVLTRNAIKCLQCNTVLESKHKHDYQACSCSNRAFVDGGLSYIRLGAMDLDLIEDLSECREYTMSEYEKLQQGHKEK